MIEELKIIADIMKDVTDGTFYAILMYMTFKFLTPVTLTAIICYTAKSMAKSFFPKLTDVKVIQVEDL